MVPHKGLAGSALGKRTRASFKGIAQRNRTGVSHEGIATRIDAGHKDERIRFYRMIISRSE